MVIPGWIPQGCGFLTGDPETMNHDADQFLYVMSKPGASSVTIRGRALRPGSRVRLCPRPGGDILDAVLAGRIARIEGVDEDDAGGIHVSVLLEDDPGRGLADTRHPAHRFFFRPEELEPADGADDVKVSRRVLVAGIGNVFFGDDGFGVEVAKRLLSRDVPAGVDVIEFGIRGMDLAYALSQYDAAILVDALPRGAAPGSIHVIQPHGDDESPVPDAHHMNPLAVLGLAERLGPLPAHVLILGCEPEPLADPGAMSMGLSQSVAASVDRAAGTALMLADRFLSGWNPAPGAA